VVVRIVTAEAQAELDALPPNVRASFERIVRLAQAFGLERGPQTLHQARFGRALR